MTRERDSKWASVPGFAGIYEVSRRGEVRSLHFDPPRRKAPTTDKDGYPIVVLYGNGKPKGYPVHRIVAETFLAEKRNPLHKEVAHLDGDLSNASVENLKWVSKVENRSHRKMHGTEIQGQNASWAKLTDADVRRIKLRLLCGESQSSLARDFNVSFGCINDIKRGRNWKHIPVPQAFAQTPPEGTS